MKILFTDLDGTLLNHDKKISEYQKNCLFDMLNKGHKLVLTSGRPLSSILEVKNNLGLSSQGSYIIAFNGALIYDCERDTILLKECVPMTDIRYLLDKAYEHHVHCHTYTLSDIVSERDTPELAQYREHIHLPVRIVPDALTALTLEPCKLIAIDFSDKQRLLDFQKEIDAKTQEHLTTLFSNDHYLEIFSKRAGKGNAIQYLCDYLSVPIADSVAVGDAENDLSMIKAAGIGAAMQNAVPLLKEHADYITTKTNDEDGLSEVIQTYMI